MMPTLMVGDRFIVDRHYYKWNPIRRGDIIIFKYPRDPKLDWVKRAVAFEGEVVELKNGEILFIDGKHVEEPYINREKGLKEEPDGQDFGPHQVPQGHVFVLGDNRMRSFDSRNPILGTIDKKMIQGKALYIFLSEDHSRIGKRFK